MKLFNRNIKYINFSVRVSIYVLGEINSYRYLATLNV